MKKISFITSGPDVQIFRVNTIFKVGAGIQNTCRKCSNKCYM